MADQEEETHVAKKSKVSEEVVEWDDLDADDHSDPLMVSEYVVEIYEYMKVLEVSSF